MVRVIEGVKNRAAKRKRGENKFPIMVTSNIVEETIVFRTNFIFEVMSGLRQCVHKNCLSFLKRFPTMTATFLKTVIS